MRERKANFEELGDFRAKLWRAKQQRLARKREQSNELDKKSSHDARAVHGKVIAVESFESRRIQ